VSFRVQDGEIRVDPWLLSGGRDNSRSWQHCFNRRVDLQVRSISQAERLSAVSDSPAGDDVWVIGGTLDAPQIIREERFRPVTKHCAHWRH